MAVGQERERMRWHFFERKRLTDKKTKSQRIDPLQDFWNCQTKIKERRRKDMEVKKIKEVRTLATFLKTFNLVQKLSRIFVFRVSIKQESMGGRFINNTREEIK
jgi:predicted nucleotidyltransferase